MSKEDIAHEMRTLLTDEEREALTELAVRTEELAQLWRAHQARTVRGTFAWARLDWYVMDAEARGKFFRRLLAHHESGQARAAQEWNAGA